MQLRFNARITSDAYLLIFRSTGTTPSYTEIREKNTSIFRLKILEENLTILPPNIQNYFNVKEERSQYIN